MFMNTAQQAFGAPIKMCCKYIVSFTVIWGNQPANTFNNAALLLVIPSMKYCGI